MRLGILLTLAYVAGAHGFAMFAPYLALFLASAYLLRRRRRAVLQPLPVRHSAVSPIFQK
jgi:hypothetical protein